MKRIEFLSHTADIRMRVMADTLQELFCAAVEGMSEVLCPSCNKNKEASEISYHADITSLDRTSLLVDFLSDILTAGFEKNAIFYKVTFDTLDERSVIAEVTGMHIDRFEEDIKAVTYHEADVRQNADGHWESMIIFDI